MSQLLTMIEAADSVVILGHTNPDGDCVGSALGMYHYIRTWKPEKEVMVCLEEPHAKFSYLAGFGEIVHEAPEKSFDLCICLDASDPARLGAFEPLLHSAAHSICVDHHKTNQGYCEYNVVRGGLSSACETLYELLDPEQIDRDTAECLYTGIIHDTGVFRFDCTSARTMEIAGKLMACGIPFTRIIDDSYFRKSYEQSQILGRALLESVRFMDGRCIFSVVKKKDMDFCGVTKKDLDGIVDQLRTIEGVEVAIFLYELENQTYKVSLRSNALVDVSEVAFHFGGGGHSKAAGCSMTGSIHDVVNNLSELIALQLQPESAQDD